MGKIYVSHFVCLKASDVSLDPTSTMQVKHGNILRNFQCDTDKEGSELPKSGVTHRPCTPRSSILKAAFSRIPGAFKVLQIFKRSFHEKKNVQKNGSLK